MRNGKSRKPVKVQREKGKVKLKLTEALEIRTGGTLGQ